MVLLRCFGLLGVLTAVTACGSRSELLTRGGSAGTDRASGGSAGSGAGHHTGGAGSGGGGGSPNCPPSTQPELLATGQKAPQEIAVFGGRVFWLSAQQLLSVSICGGPVKLLAETASSQGGRALVVHSLGVFWLTGGAGMANIRRIDHNGANEQVLVSGPNEFFGLHIDDQALYYFLRPTATPGGVMRREHGDGQPQLLAVESQSVGYVGPFFADATNVFYWVGSGSPHGDVRRVDKETGGSMPLLHGPLAASVATDDGYGYATFMHSIDQIRRFDLTSGAEALLATDQPSPRGVAVDQTWLYWTTHDTPGAVIYQALDNGSPSTLVDGLFYPWGIALDADGVYWTDYDAGTVGRIAKPATP